MLKLIVLIIAIIIIVVMFPLAKVCGDSMYPTLKDGEILVMRRVIRSKRLKNGKIYAYTKPNDERIVIKRLTTFYKLSGECYFLGDNLEDSYDSRDYGFISSENVVAVLLWNSKKQLKKKGDK